MKGFASHSDLVEQYSYYAREIKKLDIAYLHAVEGRVAGILDQTAREEESLDFLVRADYSLVTPASDKAFPIARHLGTKAFHRGRRLHSFLCA